MHSSSAVCSNLRVDSLRQPPGKKWAHLPQEWTVFVSGSGFWLTIHGQFLVSGVGFVLVPPYPDPKQHGTDWGQAGKADTARRISKLTGPDFLQKAYCTQLFWMAELSVALGKKPKFLASWLLLMSNMTYVKLQVCCKNQWRCHMSVVLNLLTKLGWGPRIWISNKFPGDTGTAGPLHPLHTHSENCHPTRELQMCDALILLYKSMELISYVLFLGRRQA